MIDCTNGAIGIAYSSTEYVLVPRIKAFATTSPDAQVSVTTFAVDFAFLARGHDPISSDWHAGEWADESTARFLFSPDELNLDLGTIYRVWLRITGAVETPVHEVGAIRIV